MAMSQHYKETPIRWLPRWERLGQVPAPKLDSELESLNADPLSIVRSEVHARAVQALSDAKGIKTKGQRLQNQIAKLEKMLASTNKVIEVSLRSNMATSVSLQKIGSKTIRLGKFSAKNLALKPGKYVLRGERLGYKDVRSEIELFPGTQDASFEASCDQPATSRGNDAS